MFSNTNKIVTFRRKALLIKINKLKKIMKRGVNFLHPNIIMLYIFFEGLYKKKESELTK